MPHTLHCNAPALHPGALTRRALAAAVSAALAVWMGASAAPAQAQTPAPPATTANGPGPATQPPPAPGTTQPAPTQAPGAPAPAGSAAPSAPAPAAAPAPAPPNYNIQYNGLVDGYYQYQFANPKGALITGRVYDVRTKTPTLNLAELNVFQNPKPGAFGFKTTLIAGDTADVNHGQFPGSSSATGEAQFKNVQQLYGTYNFGAKGGGVDVGKFYSPFGYEVTEANGNYNYSRSLAYALVPFYHAGARIYSPSYNGLVVTGYVVNAIFNTATTGVHRGGNEGYIGQINFTDPAGKYTLIGTLGFGKDKNVDGFSDGTRSKVTINDDDFTYNLNANQLVGLDYTYVKYQPDGASSNKQQGYAGYYRQQVTPKVAGVLRFSGLQADGVSGGPTARLYEITATYEYKAAANFTTRLEYRHDNSNIDGTFLGHGDTFATGGSKKNQDTLTLAGLFTF